MYCAKEGIVVEKIKSELATWKIYTIVRREE